METYVVGRGGEGVERSETVVLKIPEAAGIVNSVELTLADIAASDEIVGLTAVPVEKAIALLLLSGNGAEVELAELAAERLSTVDDEVIFPIDAVINEAVRSVPVGTGTAEVTLASGKGAKLPFIGTTVAMDVLVVKEM